MTSKAMHTVEKIGGTSMSNYAAVKNNVIFGADNSNPLTQRVIVVSAYSGITNLLLEHKKTGQPGVFSSFSANEDEYAWRNALDRVRQEMLAINGSLFDDEMALAKANLFINNRIDTTERCLNDLQRLCEHGHFSLEAQVNNVREMLASLGESHSGWNLTELLKKEGVNSRFIDLTSWGSDPALSMDENIVKALSDADLENELLIVTGYACSKNGTMTIYDRGYSEMTFSRIAVLTQAREALIHKEYHLSSADPKIAGEDNVVPIGRTNYDVADQLANLGMEAIHPRAAKGLRQSNIPLRVKNTFEPEHTGTLITSDYVSDTPRVEIIAGRRHVYALEFFNQDMVGDIASYEAEILKTCKRFKCAIVTKDVNANTVTHYLGTNLKNAKRVQKALKEDYPDAEISCQKVSIVSAIGSDMQVPGMLAKTVGALAEANISILAVHQSMRQVDMQFIVNEKDYSVAVKSLHKCLVEVHDHGRAICIALP